MNTDESDESIHLPVQYWVGLYVKNNNISYRQIMNTENLVIYSSSSTVLDRIIWQK
jgi:hypothetical protein